MTAETYNQLSDRRQLSLLRPVAAEAAKAFGLREAKLSAINHGFNTTFRVDSIGHKFALRLNTNSLRTLPEIRGETAWVRALHENGGVHVPRPISTPTGEHVVSLMGPFGRVIHSVLYEWVGGTIGTARPTPETAEKMGAAARLMNEHARIWSLPPEAKRESYDDVLIASPLRLDPTATLTEVIERGNAVVRRMKNEPMILTHADLHLANVKICRGKLAVFDFDDSLFGWPALDSAITMFYLRGNANPKELEEAYWEGRQSSPRGLGVSQDEFELMVAARQVLLANELCAMSTSSLRSLAKRYEAVSETRLRHFLDSGVFDPSAAKLDD